MRAPRMINGKSVTAIFAERSSRFEDESLEADGVVVFWSMVIVRFSHGLFGATSPLSRIGRIFQARTRIHVESSL